MNTNLERIIAKIENDFNPDNSDWIPRVAAWTIDAMAQLKVFNTIKKQRTLSVNERIAISPCPISEQGFAVYDSNGCKINKLDSKNNRCCSSFTGDNVKRIMKTIDLIIKQLGKVRLTCNGKHDVSKSYDDLCLVHNGKLASYISRKKVPAGIELTNEEYWQPVADLNGDVKEDYEGFKAEVLQLISNINSKVATGRIVVNTVNDLDSLEFGEVLIGTEVYVIEEDTSYIIDSINAFDNTKTYHEYIKDAIEAKSISTDYARLPNIVADRAISDEDGRNIKETYVTKEYLFNLLGK